MKEPSRRSLPGSPEGRPDTAGGDLPIALAYSDSNLHLCLLQSSLVVFRNKVILKGSNSIDVKSTFYTSQ